MVPLASLECQIDGEVLFPNEFPPNSFKASALTLKPLTPFIIVFLLSLFGCKEEVVVEEFIHNTGQIQVLNGCGYSGAAELVRNFLAQKGFDIVEFGNAKHWNYKQTIIVARIENTGVARDLGKILKTNNVVQILDSSRMVEATVYVGKDYYRRINP